eukprot:g7087.t1
MQPAPTACQEPGPLARRWAELEHECLLARDRLDTFRALEADLRAQELQEQRRTLYTKFFVRLELDRHRKKLPPNGNQKANASQKSSGNGSASQTNAKPGDKAGGKKANNAAPVVSCLAVSTNDMDIPRTMETYLAPAADGGGLMEVGAGGKEGKTAFSFMAATSPMIFIGEEEENVPGDQSNGKVNVADFWTCFNNACVSELRYWKWLYNFKVVPADWETYVKGLEREVVPVSGLEDPQDLLQIHSIGRRQANVEGCDRE